MKVVAQKDGSFAFLFDKNEKQLGIDILNSMHTDNPHVARAIAQSIREVQYAGLELPHNVVPIH
jgi:hypothetical protein